MDPIPKYQGADWIQANHLRRTMTPFERLVADIVGQVERGIYHLPRKSLGLSRWDGDRVAIAYPRIGMSTWDNPMLTDYVGLCHLFAVRLEITPMIAVVEGEADDSESWGYQKKLVSHVCPPGWDDGAQLKTFERQIPNEDFDPDQPEHPVDNPRTVTREFVRSAEPCLELLFSPRKHEGKYVFDWHPTLDQMVVNARRLGQWLTAEHRPDDPPAPPTGGIGPTPVQPAKEPAA